MKLKPSEIKPNPDNPRQIKDDKFKKLVQSLKDFPEMAEVREVVVNKDHMILGGNMRFKAMQEAGWKEIPVRVVDWPEEKQREFIIKDNVSGGEWDWDVLANQWDSQELDDWGLDLPAQFGQEEVEEDEAPEVSKDPPQSVLGAVYQLGRHRLMCGDSTKGDDVATLMDGKLANLVHTDPPYNVDYKSRGGHGYSEGKYEHLKAFDDNKTPEDFQQFLYDVAQNIHDNTIDNVAIYIWHYDGGFRAEPFYNMFKHCDWTRDCSIIWVKNNASMGWQLYRQKHETLSYGWKSGKVYQTKRRDLTSTWQVSKDATQSYQHPTQKPIELCSMPINNSSKKDDIVLDLFLGSGSTLIACEQLDRICYGMELDPYYCDVIRKRYAKFINNNELPENWVELTPTIEKE